MGYDTCGLLIHRISFNDTMSTEEYLQLGYDYFLPNSYLFTIHDNPPTSLYPMV
jgi:hypothetical protein